VNGEPLADSARASILLDHYGLIYDALVSFHSHVGTRRNEVMGVLTELREIHDHDPEDEHCTSNCNVWYPGAYCEACGACHRKARLASDPVPAAGGDTE
jgi:hypothetical protein